MMTKANKFILTAIMCFNTLFFYMPPTAAQCNTCPAGSAGGKGPAGDLDGDGVCNDKDVDDDNDGISDIAEGFTRSTNVVTNGNFGTDTETTSQGNLNGWTTNGSGSTKADNNWIAEHGAAIAWYDGAQGLNLYQVIPLKTSDTPGITTLSLRIKAVNAVDVPSHWGFGNLDIWFIQPGNNTYGDYVKLFTVHNTISGDNLATPKVWVAEVHTSLVHSLSVDGDYTSREFAVEKYVTIRVNINTANLSASGALLAQRNNKPAWTNPNQKGADDFYVDDFSYTYQQGTDTDGDGVPNHQDLDSDNDGILDVIEANPTGYNATALGTGCRYPDGNNTVNGCEDGSTDYSVDTPKSTGTDGIPDYLSLDSDEDACPDATEANLAAEFNVNGSEFEVTEVDSNGLTDAGCDARPRDNQWIDGIPSQADGCRQKEEGGEIPLSVIFNKVGASVRDGMLQVSWTTETEKQSDYFEIEVSKDGKNWSKAGTTIKTKATDTNGTGRYSYEQSIALTGMSIMGSSLFLLSMGMMFRRNKWFGVVLVIVTLSATFYACSKENNAGTKQYEPLYVRIKQTNNNGRVSYSDAVRAVIK